MKLPITHGRDLFDAFGREVIRQRYTVLPLSKAAQMLGVTAATLRQQIANGRLHASKIGPMWIITEEEVRRYRHESLRR